VIPICKVWDVGSIHGTESWPFVYGKTFCHLIFLDRENARVDIDYTALTLETLRKKSKNSITCQRHWTGKIHFQNTREPEQLFQIWV
jgi:hypothetical protein